MLFCRRSKNRNQANRPHLLMGMVILSAFNVLAQGQHKVTLAWSPSPSSDVAGYHIFCGTVSQNYTTVIDVGNTTTNTVSGLMAGVTYYFAVRAYDMAGPESVFSNEVSYTPCRSVMQINSSPTRQAILKITGESGCTYDVLASETITNWTVIGTVTVGTVGSVEFVDPDASGFPMRCYRLREN